MTCGRSSGPGAGDQVDFESSTDLVEKLNEMEDAPWPDMRKGKGLSTHKLASLLKDFEVAPESKRRQARLQGCHASTGLRAVPPSPYTP